MPGSILSPPEFLSHHVTHVLRQRVFSSCGGTMAVKWQSTVYFPGERLSQTLKSA
ncbi:hypothetical protein HanIR_Chr11g0505551 [Helianthus annuus]|nr:hypothetical protein HanIR_Chr11g0505551 [Helianthus annuus]